jgi:membrane protein
MGMLRARFLSFAMVLGTGFVLLVSLVLSAAIATLNSWLGSYMPIPPVVAQLINLAVSFVIITLLFAMIFKVLPDAKVQWHDVWIGAALTAFLFVIGKWALGLYIGRQATDSATSAASALPLLLLWVYYAAQILFFGAEFTQVYANKYGSHIEPSENAVAVTDMDRAQQGMPRQQDVERAANDKNRGAGGVPAHAGSPASVAAADSAGPPAARGPAKSGNVAPNNPQHTVEDAAAVMTGFGIYVILSRLFRRNKGEK